MDTYHYKLSETLRNGIFQGRFKRFFAEIHAGKEVITAHLPNTGSLKSVNTKGQPCLYSISDNPERKLKATLEAIQSLNGTWVGINTQTPNRVTKELVQGKMLSHWAGYKNLKPEFKISKESRLDFALWNDESKRHFIEVKNVTLMEEVAGKNKALFPDSVTERGQKHLREMMRLISEGHTCELLFFIQRNDCGSFGIAEHIDQEYGKIFKDAVAAGLKVTPISMEFTEQGLHLNLSPMSIK